MREDVLEALRKNCAFIQEKSGLVDDLTVGLYSVLAKEYLRQEHTPPTPDDAAGLYESIHPQISGVQASPDFARFCYAFSEAYGGTLADFADSDTDRSSPSVAYLQNTFSDRAYRVFSTQFERISASYYPGFREVCEEVYNSRCRFAMLPVFSSRDGQLLSFRKLISKYDLKITLVTDILMNDDSIMRFALLQKGIDSRAFREYPFLDISVVLDNSEYGMFLSAFEALGAVVLMLHSLPLEYSDDRYSLTLQLDIRNSSRDALFFFLEGSHIRYDIVGVYDILSG